MSKWHLAVQIQTPNCRIWLGVPMDITCGCEVEHHPLSPPGRPPRPGWGRPPGRSAQCTRIPVWWALGGRLWRMSLAPTAQPRGRGACCGAENSRRQKIGGYRYTIHPHNFIKMMQQNPPQPKACCVRPAGSAGPQGPRLLVLVGLSIASAIGLCVALRRRWRSSVRTLVVHQQCLRSMPHTPIGRAFCGACHSKSRRCKTSIRPSFPD